MTTTADMSPSAVGERRAPCGVGWFIHRKSLPKSFFVKRRAAVYQLTDRLHDGRTVYVSAGELVATVSAWLAELGATSPLVEDLAQAVCAGDWSKTHSLGDLLSVEVTGVT
jgi:hypothetical protein